MNTSALPLNKFAIAALGLLSAVAPLATDMYLASLPQVTEDFHTTSQTTQLTLSAFMVGMAAGQLFAGPLSDKIGRMRPLQTGVVLCLLASIACIFAPNIQLLIAARFVMGAAGATGLVVSRAIVSDSTNGIQTARLMSILMLINSFAPIIAPLLGGFVLEIGTWRLVFVVLSAFMALSLVLSLKFLKESLPAERRLGGSLLSVYKGIPGVLAIPRYRGFMLTYALSFGTLFAYVSGSSFVLQNVLGLSSLQFTLVFGMNSVGIILMSTLVTFLVGKVAVRKMLTIGVVAQLIISALLAVEFLLGPTLIPTLILLFCSTMSFGLVAGNATSLALMQGRRLAGSASATLGTTQSLVGALTPALVGIAGGFAYMPLALTMLVFAILAALALFSTPIQEGDWRKEGAAEPTGN